MYVHSAGFAVIIPEKKVDRIPPECPVCKFIMFTSDDIESFKMFRCCCKCEFKWARPRQFEWTDGWRPSKNEIKLEKCKRQKKLPCVV